MKIILEEYWNVGKTKVMNTMKEDHGLVTIEEPNHFDHNDLDLKSRDEINQWYLNSHLKRQQKFFKKDNAVMERSIISSLAFQYASKKTIEDVEDLMTDFIEKYLEYKTMIVYLYDPEMDVADQSVGVSTEGLDKVKNSDNFKRRYGEFYSQILPNKYGITPLKLKVLDENNQLRRSEKNVVSDIVTAYKEDRLGQINVVCTRGGRKECLVLKRNEKKGGFWQTITGGIETRELLPEAARREVEEEIGVSTDKIEDIRPSDYTFSYIGGEGYELHERVYACEIDSDARVRISDEHVDAKWCNKEEAVDTVKYEGNKKAIESVFKS